MVFDTISWEQQKYIYFKWSLDFILLLVSFSWGRFWCGPSRTRPWPSWWPCTRRWWSWDREELKWIIKSWWRFEVGWKAFKCFFLLLILMEVSDPIFSYFMISKVCFVPVCFLVKQACCLPLTTHLVSLIFNYVRVLTANKFSQVGFQYFPDHL